MSLAKLQQTGFVSLSCLSSIDIKACFVLLTSINVKNVFLIHFFHTGGQSFILKELGQPDNEQ